MAARGTALLTDLMDVTGQSPPSGDAHRRRRLVVLDAVARLASLAEEGPTLLALEDLHWSDELSLEIVAHLARQLPSLPLCVVGTLRTDELHQDAPARAWRARMLLQRLAVELPLAPLDRDQSEQMVRALLGGRRTSRRLVELVHQRSGGVPLHVEELVSAAAQGHLTPSSHYVPETLAEAVQQRFEALSPTARDSAVAAAVVRRSFDLDLLAEVADRHPRGRGHRPRRAGRPALRAGGVAGVVRLPARPHPRRRRGERTAGHPPRPPRPGRGRGAAPPGAGR